MLLLKFPEFGVNIKSSSKVGLPLLLSILRQISVKIKCMFTLNFGNYLVMVKTALIKVLTIGFLLNQINIFEAKIIL